MSAPHPARPRPRPRPRFSSTVTEPFDPVYSYDEHDFSDTDGHAPSRRQRAQTSPAPAPVSYPFSPYESPATAGMPPVGVGVYGGEFFESPESSPRLQPTVMPHIRPRTASTVEVPSMGAWIAPLPPSAARVGTGTGTRERDFAIPPLSRQSTFGSIATLDDDEADVDVENVPLSPVKKGGGVEVEERGDREERVDKPKDKGKRMTLAFDEHGPGHGGMSRHESMATRLGRSIIGTVTRGRTSAGAGGAGRWGTLRRSRLLGDEDYTELGALEEREMPIGMDVSTFGPEYTVPHQTAKAMETAGFNENLAYTDTGEAIDLSILSGFNDEGGFNSFRSLETRSIHRASTFDTYNKQSFYFPPGRHVPNWKPIVLQTWYLVMLIILTIIMIATVEVLYQLSDRHVLRKGPIPEGGGLFSYIKIDHLTTLQFAIWKYVPTLVGVVYGILWKVTDEELKRSEPYYQLSKGSSGALAAESLNIEYHTVWSPMVPIAALKYRQFVVAAGGMISFLASTTVPIFLSVVIRVDPSQKERKSLPDGGKSAIKRLVVDAVWTRLVEVNLAVIVVLAIYVVWKLTHRRSGLLGDPSGIAGIAAMANKSHILMDFRDLDVADENRIHKQLAKRTYILHKGALWQAEVLADANVDGDASAPRAMNPHPLLLRIKGMGPFMFFCFLMLALLPFMVYNPAANVIIDKAPWVITGISIFLKSVWELLEKDMRMLEPFWQLFHRNAGSSVLTLDYSATIPGYIIIKALSKGHFLLAWVTSVTILIEVLTVVMGSLDVQGGEESHLSSSISFGLAIAIFVLVLITEWAVLYFRRHPFLPRQPGTISSVLAFIHQSRMLTDFEGTETESTLQRKKRLAKVGKRYGFGWYLGRDGKRHLGIDHEPLLEGYRFGMDPRKAVVDAPVGWERYDGAG